MKNTEAICKRCGKPFVKVFGMEKQCPVCRKLPYYIPVNKQHTVTCCVCGKEFETLLYNKKYCSDKCRCSSHYTPVLAEKQCPVCGKKFKTGYKQQVFCSLECRKNTHKETKNV